MGWENLLGYMFSSLFTQNKIAKGSNVVYQACNRPVPGTQTLLRSPRYWARCCYVVSYCFLDILHCCIICLYFYIINMADKVACKKKTH